MTQAPNDTPGRTLTFAERGLPYTVFPTGWFQAAWSAELAVGDVMPLRYFDTDLVLFRTNDGEAVVLDAICRHLGANLGYGGTARGDCITCPYHGWKWASDGALVDVPYSERTPKVSLRSWPTREAHGIVYVWHAADGAAPTWDPPVIHEDEDAGFHRAYPHGTHRERLLTHPQFVIENFPDIVHMKYVHGWNEIPIPEFIDLATPVARNAYPGVMVTPKGNVAFHSEGYAYGIGINVARFTGGINACTLGAYTPIDQTSSMGFASVWVPRASPDESQPSGFAAALIRANIGQLFGQEHDRPIFEHGRYQTKPLLLPEEAALHRDFRRWSDQFYPTPAEQGSHDSIEA